MGLRLAAVVRLVHPFPSLLDGVVVGAVAWFAGAAPLDALRLALAMTALQFGIGATNDIIDAPTDAGNKAGKPIPAGLISPTGAWGVAAAAFVAGLALAVSSGPAVAGLAVVVMAIGLAYDLRLKGTAWSWLPFAVGIPILPVFGWLGTTGSLPAPFAILVPAAVLAGAALAIANSLADVERDRAAGVGSIAMALGERTAWLVNGLLVAGVVVAAVVTAIVSAGWVLPSIAVIVASPVPIVGAALGWGGGPGRRERAWEVEAIGIAGIALAWVWAVLV